MLLFSFSTRHVSEPIETTCLVCYLFFISYTHMLIRIAGGANNLKVDAPGRRRLCNPLLCLRCVSYIFNFDNTEKMQLSAPRSPYWQYGLHG